jgi:branched-chain amino acid transport system ATP-binding protein
MLTVSDLTVAYGKIDALHALSFEVNDGEIVALIGANGAGKSTTLRTISGLMQPRSGSISLDGRQLQGKRAHRIAAAGVVQVPEGRRVFPDLTVRENLDMGAFLCRDKSVVNEGLDRVFELFPVLADRRQQSGGTLSGGEQQMLAIGRALMAQPRVLMLDEPSMGLAPVIVQRIFDIITELNGQGMTILLVEQNANQALAIADRGYVLETGRIILAGTGRELLVNPQVRAAYLGMGTDNPASPAPAEG